MSIETDRAGIRLLVDIFIRAHKAKKLGLLFEILIATFQAKMSWDAAMGRLKGTFYGQLVDGAADKYKRENPRDFECDVSGVPGMARWQKENPTKHEP